MNEKETPNETEIKKRGSKKAGREETTHPRNK